MKQFGTPRSDNANSVATDAFGNIYVSGYAQGTPKDIEGASIKDSFLAKYSSDGTQLWLEQFGTSEDDYAYDVTTDTDNNIYVSGYTEGILPDNTGVGFGDSYLAKYDSDGTQLWLKQFGTFGTDSANSVATDTAGNIYVSGDTSDAFPGNTHAGNTDVYLAKYSSDGIQMWVEQFGTSEDDFAYSVTTDTDGNVYFVGYTDKAFPGHTSVGFRDSFLVKYDSEGTRIWVEQFGTSQDDHAYGVTADPDNNIYVTGSTYGTFSGESGTEFTDSYLAKYDSDGTQMWVAQYNLVGGSHAWDVAADTDGNIYTGGVGFMGHLGGEFGNGYLTKYDGSGNVLRE